MSDGGHHKSAIEIAIEPLTGTFGDEEASVTGRPFQVPFGRIIFG
jgi:hypothetical protein